MRSMLPFVPCLLALAACSSPPKPPAVDHAARRPVNSALAIELQVCTGELQNTRIRAGESVRRADLATATLARVSAQQQAVAAQCTAAATAATPSPVTTQPVANRIHSIRFDFGSTQVVLDPDAESALIELAALARAAPLVLLRGRTDGTTDTAAESRVARERAFAVRDWLVGAGVDPARIRTTYQPIGDPVADNTSAGGRGLNRRVEIEVYWALPVALSASTPAQR